MLYRFWFVFAVLGVFTFGASAAPSVRVLGAKTNTTTSGTQSVGTATPVRATTLSIGKGGTNLTRPASVRSIGSVSAIKPAAANLNKGSGNTGLNNVNRLSVGKYLHQTGVASGTIKPVVSAETAGNVNDTITELTESIEDLKLKLNDKQDNLTFGDGLYIDENGDLSVDADLVGLADAMDTYKDEVVAAAAAAAESAAATTTYNTLITYKPVNTVYDAADGKRKYISIVNTFDEDVFEEFLTLN